MNCIFFAQQVRKYLVYSWRCIPFDWDLFSTQSAVFASRKGKLQFFFVTPFTFLFTSLMQNCRSVISATSVEKTQWKCARTRNKKSAKAQEQKMNQFSFCFFSFFVSVAFPLCLPFYADCNDFLVDENCIVFRKHFGCDRFSHSKWKSLSQIQITAAKVQNSLDFDYFFFFHSRYRVPIHWLDGFDSVPN